MTVAEADAQAQAASIDDDLNSVAVSGREAEQAAKLEALRTALLQGEQQERAASQLVQGGELASPSDMLQDDYLRRWLRARSWNVESAARSILSHAAWRAAMAPTGRVPASECPNELASGKAFMLGCDTQGRAVLLIQARKHNAWGRRIDELERFCCYILDNAIAACDLSLNPRGHIAVILDLTDMGALNMDVAAVTALFKLLGEHYVERLGQMIMYNPPLIFWGVWNTMSPLLPPVTLKKIMVISPKEQQAMLDVVGAGILPREYGGGLEEVAPLA